MDTEVAQRLIDLNQQFYQTFAVEFSATRRRLQPGVQRLLKSFQPGQRLLDLGCGNGELWRTLAQTASPELYVGLDFSPGLLAAASEDLAGDAPPAVFMQHDLAGEDWSGVQAHAPFDLALAFAVLHHLPGRALRLHVLEKVRECLAPGGRFIHSEWQFLHSDRLRKRIQPWERAGLSDAQVDAGDYLLDWRSGGYGLRYVHHYSEDELAGLAAESGFSVNETFYSDGEDGRLSIYQVWDT